MGSGLSTPLPKFRPRGLCADIDDTSLADGVYIVTSGTTQASLSAQSINLDVVETGSLLQETGTYSSGGTRHDVRTQTLTIRHGGSAALRHVSRTGQAVDGVWSWSNWVNTYSPEAGWSTLTLNGWTSIYSYYRKVGTRVDIALAFSITAGGNTTMPVGYRPGLEIYIPGAFFETGTNETHGAILSIGDTSSGYVQASWPVSGKYPGTFVCHGSFQAGGY